MNVNNGDIGSMKEMETKYANEVNNLVPVPEKEISVLKGWGKKKRERYAELIKEEGATNDEAFYIVEHLQGIVPEPIFLKVKSIQPHNSYMLERRNIKWDDLEDETLYMGFEFPLQQCHGEFKLINNHLAQDEMLVEPLKEGMVQKGKDFGGITFADDFEMTMKNPITGEEKVMVEGEDYTVEETGKQLHEAMVDKQKDL